MNGKMYTAVFDSKALEWVKEREYNLAYLTVQERSFNDLLEIRGYVFLNEVLKALGLTMIAEGQTYGWRYDPDDNTIENCVDFGIYETEPNIFELHFETDGEIYKQITY